MQVLKLLHHVLFIVVVLVSTVSSSYSQPACSPFTLKLLRVHGASGSADTIFIQAMISSSNAINGCTGDGTCAPVPPAAIDKINQLDFWLSYNQTGDSWALLPPAGTECGDGGFNYGLGTFGDPFDVGSTLTYQQISCIDCPNGAVDFWVSWSPETWYNILALTTTDAVNSIELVNPNGQPCVIGPTYSPKVKATWNCGAAGNTNADELRIAIEGTDPLPLDLLTFRAAREGHGSIVLSWKTANEVKTKLFVIQRSSNRELWDDISVVEAAVNSTNINQYHFLDKNVFSGHSNREVYYYRLKMVDQDDSFEYSNIEVVSFSGFLDAQNEFKLYLYPNPARDGVNVEITQPANSESLARLELYDVTGHLVVSRDVDSGSETEYFDFAELNMAPGTYIMRAIDVSNMAHAFEKLVVLR